jgi:hypothetical protein
MLFQSRRDDDIHIDCASTFSLRKKESDMIEGTMRNIPGGFHYASNIGQRNLSREGLDKEFHMKNKLDLDATDK